LKLHDPRWKNRRQSARRNAPRLGLLSFMGRKEDALREGQRAVQVKPIARDDRGAVVQAFLL
jgi:hypothetical protein